MIFEEAFENVFGHSIDISPIDGRILMLQGEQDLPAITRIDMITNYPALLDSE